MVKYTSNLNKVLSHYDRNIQSWLEKCADVGLENIKNNTPVKSGELKKANQVEKEPFKIIWLNPREYAPFVEFGTMYMYPRAFMRKGLMKSIPEFVALLKQQKF